MATEPTKRFSNRAENYAKYRPRYPQAVLTCLIDECDLNPAQVIADIGSGTGILSELFLQNGNPVFGVEPNQAMRGLGEKQLAHYPHFTSITGTAEATNLPNNSVDWITAGQAFHWFDRPTAKLEFQRILRPGGRAMFVWNAHRPERSPELKAYEDLVAKFRVDYQPANQRRADIDMDSFLDGNVELREFDNEHTFDFESMKGRFLSSSGIPLSEHPLYDTMLGELRDMFDAFQENDRMRLLYTTRMYFGRIGA